MVHCIRQCAAPLFLVAALLTSGCGTVKNPAFWSAMAQSDAGPQPSQRVAPAPQRSELLLFGGRGHDVFLGCLNCGEFDSASVWNEFGTHGSTFSDVSIWNKFGTYGSEFSDESPWNRFGQNPPVIVDRSGGFYGYFTANRFFPKRTTIPAFVRLLDKGDDQ